METNQYPEGSMLSDSNADPGSPDIAEFNHNQIGLPKPPDKKPFKKLVKKANPERLVILSMVNSIAQILCLFLH